MILLQHCAFVWTHVENDTSTKGVCEWVHCQHIYNSFDLVDDGMEGEGMRHGLGGRDMPVMVQIAFIGGWWFIVAY